MNHASQTDLNTAMTSDSDVRNCPLPTFIHILVGEMDSQVFRAPRMNLHLPRQTTAVTV